MCYRCLDREFSVEQSNIYFTVIGQAFHELWQFETRHANARKSSCGFSTFYFRSSFLDYAGLWVKLFYRIKQPIVSNASRGVQPPKEIGCNTIWCTTKDLCIVTPTPPLLPLPPHLLSHPTHTCMYSHTQNPSALVKLSALKVTVLFKYFVNKCMF